MLETTVSNTHASDREGPPAVEVIYNGAVAQDDEPFVVVDDAEDSEHANGEEAGEDGAQARYAYAVWKLPVFLGRPRMRLQGPTVSFAAMASLRPAEDASDRRKNGYLESRAPLGMNLLQSFGMDPALGGVQPKLSAQRVSRVAPATHTRDQQRPLPGKKAIIRRIFPAVHTRVRFARTNTAPASASIIALLEVDFTPFFDCEALLSSIALSLPSGVVTDLNAESPGLALPLSCVAHDHITFMYRLSPREHELAAPVLGGPPSPAPSRDLDITVSITALVEPGVCVPSLSMSWTTTIDFTLPVNPGFGTTLNAPTLNRLHRPSQLSIDGIASLTAPQVARPDALPSLEAATARNTETSIPDFGITMTFSAPEDPVYAGDEFAWTVLVVNRTSPNPAATPAGAPASIPPQPRKLALVVIPKRRRNDLRIPRPPSAHATAGSRGGKAAPVDQVADAVLDENVVHAMQRSSLVDGVDVVCLSADVRVGPLAPGACHAVELRFVALRGGEDEKGEDDGGLVLGGVEAVRVVDLATQEHVDVRELPVVVVRGRGKGKGDRVEDVEEDDED